MFTAAILFLLTCNTAAFNAGGHNFYKALTTLQDTVKPNPAKNSGSFFSSVVKDTIPAKPVIDAVDRIPITDTFSLKISKDSIDAPVHYEAEDSVVVLVQEKQIVLYGKTTTEYKDILLTAPKVTLDQQTQILTAVNKQDSAGYSIERAYFAQGESRFESDTIRFNFKTQKGLTKNTFTQRGEMFVHGEDIKKVDANTMFARQGRFTTCNLDEPHFAFMTNKLKVINNKLAVSGPTHPEFEKVPIPIYLPFGYFPMSQGRHSGFLPPQFARNEQFGLGLEGLGYYKVLNDYFDVTLRGNIYSYGSWSANLTPTYRKRYRYNGQLNLSYQVTKANFKGDPDFLKNKSFFINWGHNVDQRAMPGTNFSANVRAGSTSYNRFVPNSPQQNFQNQLSSSISYSKTWIGKPYNLTLNVNHNQNNALGLINLSLPDAGFTVSTLYPFQKKELTGSPKWYEKLGVAYNGSFRNQISFYDSAFKLKNLIDTLQWGAQHSLPITLSLPPIGPLLISPNITYDEKWIAQKFRRKWNPTLKKLDTTVTKGIFTDRSMSFGLGINTSVFGTFQFKNSRLIALRHVIRPSVSINYKPDLSKAHFYSEQIDTLRNRYRFSEYEGSLYGYYPEGKYGGMGFQIDNNLEMKWRSKKDTGSAAIKKIRLIDGFGISGGYNFIADSFQLSTFQLYLRSTLFEKINITAGAVLDPYQKDSRGFSINRYTWQDGRFNLGKIRSGNISMSTDFRSKPRDPKKEEENKKRIQQQYSDPNLAGDQQRLLDYMQRNPSEFVDFNIPWSVNLAFSLRFDQRIKSDYSGFETDFNSNLNFNGSFALAPKWNFNVNGYFDFNTKKLQTFQMAISREMHCWQMSISVTPIGLFRFFNISLSPKASILRDLRINRTRSFSSF